MPVNYNVSAQPWLRPADSAGAYAKGYGLGQQSGQAQAQIAMERARLQEASNRTAVEIALRQQQLERESMVDQQKLEVAKAYHEQQASLKNQELEMKQQALQEKVKQAAQQQMQMERFRQAIARGDDPALATLMHASGLPNMAGATSGAVRQLSDRMNPDTAEYMPIPFNTVSGKTGYYSKKTGALHFEPGDNTPQMRLGELKGIMQLSKQDFGGDTNKMAAVKGQASSEMQRILSGAPAKSSGAQQKVNPWTTNPDKLVKGEIYLHDIRGPLRYDRDVKDAKGKMVPHFSPVTPNQTSMETPSDTEIAAADTGESDATDLSADDSEEA